MEPKSVQLDKKQRNNKLAKHQFDEESRAYFKCIKSKPILNLDVENVPLSNNCRFVTSNTAIVLWIFETYGLDEWIELSLLPLEKNVENSSSDFSVSNNGSEIYTVIESCSDLQIKYTSESLFKNQSTKAPDNGLSKRPFVYIPEKKLIICGLCSVLRFILKFAATKIQTQMDNEMKIQNYDTYNGQMKTLQDLLGFRLGCLQACSEVSMWTKFCEIDIIKTVNQTLDKLTSSSKITQSADENNSDVVVEEIPKNLVRFEHHLREPVRVHNIRKETQDKLKKMKSDEKLPVDGTGNKGICAELLEHDFAEGPHMLLSDLILFPCVYLLLHIYGESVFVKTLPKTLAWCKKLDNLFKLSSSSKIQLKSCASSHIEHPCDAFWSQVGKQTTPAKWTAPLVPEKSMYKSDPARYNPTLRLFTRQYEVDEAFGSFSSSGIIPFEVEDIAEDLNWDEIPVQAQPEGGRLPKERREKKRLQLSSMVVEVLKVLEKVKESRRDSSASIRIVDFCSGGGHVGILLAWLLPKCQIILVENKDSSLRRASERLEQLGLTNVTLYQCNLDYFDGSFELGVALHSCGTATDLILQKSIAANACFVCCPCCYGSIQPNHMVHYPASDTFKASISLRHYLIFAHTSDQTHDERIDPMMKNPQGKLAMRIVNTDRLRNAQENGYAVYLTKMPEIATLKNLILVGLSPVQNFQKNP